MSKNKSLKELIIVPIAEDSPQGPKHLQKFFRCLRLKILSRLIVYIKLELY